MKKLLLAGVAMLWLVSTATAAEITVRSVPKPYANEAVVILQGQIYQGDDIEFKLRTQALRGSVFVFLDSRGGEISTAINIGSFVHMNQWTTAVTNGDVCNSACALIWFSGVHRELGSVARIGVHSAGMRDDPTKRNGYGNLVVARYLASIGIPTEIINRFAHADPCCMEYIDYEEAHSLGLLNEQPNRSKKRNYISPWYPIERIP